MITLNFILAFAFLCYVFWDQLWIWKNRRGEIEFKETEFDPDPPKVVGQARITSVEYKRGSEIRPLVRDYRPEEDANDAHRNKQ